jgi:hypothetical protein
MPAVFLTTPALQIYLLWQQSALSKFLNGLLAKEVWVSPLSHAMIRDTFLQSGASHLSRRGLREEERHRRKMETINKTSYPFFNQESLRIWSEIRSIKVDIPAYDDGVAKYPAQTVGADELLVFATAGAFSIPLVGPAPIDPETLEYFSDLGITFRGVAATQSIPEEKPKSERPSEGASLMTVERLFRPDENL